MSPLKPALLSLCLCGLAAAQPIRFEDEQTGFIWITDKLAGEQVIMSGQHLIFLNTNGRNWQVEMPEDDGWFSSALWDKDGVYVSVRQGKISGSVLIRKYSKVGKLLWEHDTEYGPFGSLDQIWPDANLVGYYTHGPDAISETRYGLLNTQTGRALAVDVGEVLGVSPGLLLTRIPGPNFLTEDVIFYVHKAWEEEINFLPYLRYDMQGKQIEGTFPTPPRSDCGNYAMPPEVANPNSAHLGSGYYAQADVRGEYIYAHRADQCGKFTYKFHWTDANNPAPEILDGWQ